MLYDISGQSELSPSRCLQMHVDFKRLDLEGVLTIRKTVQLGWFKLLVTTEQTFKHVLMYSVIIIDDSGRYARKKIENAQAAKSRATRGARTSLVGFEQVTPGRRNVVDQLMDTSCEGFEITSERTQHARKELFRVTITLPTKEFKHAEELRPTRPTVRIHNRAEPDAL